jgi:UDP-N-acetyl-D-glucosamine dehydrogenase
VRVGPPDGFTRNRLLSRLRACEASIAVVGLGYVGLPLSVAIAAAGHHVIGIESSPERIRSLRTGQSYVSDVEDTLLQELLATRRLRLTEDASGAADADATIIAVPTPLSASGTPDTSFIEAAADALAGVIRGGSLVVLESTTYPGTTEEILAPRLARRGLVAGADVYIGYSPERLDPGNATWNVSNTPKLVAGLTRHCLEATLALYCSFVASVVPVSSVRTAEMAKVYEIAWRLVNVVLANELHSLCRRFDVDPWEVISACATKPFGFMPFYPGPGAGGHCLPVDTAFLTWRARQLGISPPLLDLAWRLNVERPVQIVQSVSELLTANGLQLAGARVAVIGVAYKKNTSDTRESPAIRIIEHLREAGAQVVFHDPHVAGVNLGHGLLRSEALKPSLLDAQDCIIVATDHDAIDWQLISQYRARVVDTRNALRGQDVVSPD